MRIPKAALVRGEIAALASNSLPGEFFGVRASKLLELSLYVGGIEFDATRVPKVALVRGAKGWFGIEFVASNLGGNFLVFGG